MPPPSPPHPTRFADTEEDDNIEVEARIDPIVLQILLQEYKDRYENEKLYTIFKSKRWDACVRQLITQLDAQVRRVRCWLRCAVGSVFFNDRTRKSTRGSTSHNQPPGIRDG